MFKRSMIALIMSSASLISCSTVEDLAPQRLATANLIHANGTPAGTVQLLAINDRVSLNMAVSGIPKGPHGFHLHTTGACKTPDFTSAGGHLNPHGNDHGTLDPDGPHLGDLPNLVVDDSDVTTLSVDLGEDRAELMSALFDADGTAVVIHADPDDYRTNPSGNAGSRIVCGVLKPA